MTAILDVRPTIVLRTEENQVVDETIAALIMEPSIFQRDGRLVRVATNAPPRGSIAGANWGTRIESLPLPALREAIAKHARLVVETEKGELERHPPEWLVSEIAARGTWPGIRYLVGVVNEPVLLMNGEVLQEPGYESTAGLWYAPRDERIAVNPHPSLEDARYAAESLNELVCDFPFLRTEHSSGFLAAVLTPFARFALRGPAPLFVIDANTPGTGKSLLADVIGIIASGVRMPRTAQPRSDDETRKLITSIAMEGLRLMLIDNVSGTLGSPALDAALTSVIWRDRVLGRSQTTGAVTLLATFFATGNNVILGGDTHRRALPIRLETDREKPEERRDFAHHDLLRHVEGKRYAYARDAMTILRAYHFAGRPSVPMTPWGSYEEWSRYVRAPLVWLGLPDPYLTRVGVGVAADHETDLLRRVLDAIQTLDDARTGLTTADLVAKLKRPDREPERAVFAEWVGRTEREGVPAIRSLAMKLHHAHNRIISGRALQKRADRWILIDTVPGATTGTTGSRSGSSATSEAVQRD